MTEELTPEFDPNDFAIRLRPHMVDGKWNGDVDICIMWDDKHKLTGEDFTKLMHLTKMICASVPMHACAYETHGDAFAHACLCKRAHVFACALQINRITYVF